MKRLSVVDVCLAAAVVIVVAVCPAFAQTTETIRVNLPYTCIAGGVTLPAGEYTIRAANDDGSFLEIQSVAGNISAAVMTERLMEPRQSVAPRTEVTIRHDGDKAFLDKIWLEGEMYGYVLVPTRPR